LTISDFSDFSGLSDGPAGRGVEKRLLFQKQASGISVSEAYVVLAHVVNDDVVLLLVIVLYVTGC